MPEASRVIFNIQDFTTGVSTPLTGICYVIGITKRGPVENPVIGESLINSWPQFERTFGGLVTYTDFPLLCKRALARGAKLRVCRVDSTATPSVKATAKNIPNGDDVPVNLFSVQPKYAGADYNKVSVAILAASNGNADYWDLSITHSSEPGLNEYYANISAFKKDTATNQTNLNDIKKSSRLLDFTYLDASSATLLVPEVAVASAFTGGVDPIGQVDADYTGAMATFDAVDDGLVMAVPEMDSDAINSAGATYAKNRGDIVFFAHLPNSINTAAGLVTERVTIASNTKHVAFFGGGLRVRHPETLLEVSISEMGDVLGLLGYVHGNFGAWYSLAGQLKGEIPDSIGVVNNFGSSAKFADLNTLANAQINMVVVKNGIVQLSGNFSGQYENNVQRFLSVTFLVLWIRKAFIPTLESYLEEPNDPTTWRSIYNQLRATLDKLVSPQQRALYKYEYYGDQDANTIDDVQVNDPVDIENGKYKINLKIWPIPALQELTLNLMLVQGEGVTVE